MVSPSQAVLLALASLAVAAATAGGAAVPAPSAAMFNYAAGLGSEAGSGGGGGGNLGFLSQGGLGAAEQAELSFADGMGPPDPSKFRTPEELKDYLERLQLYYALVGRPRFGKRSGSAYRRRSWQQSEEESDPEDSGDRIYGYAVFF